MNGRFYIRPAHIRQTYVVVHVVLNTGIIEQFLKNYVTCYASWHSELADEIVAILDTAKAEGYDSDKLSVSSEAKSDVQIFLTLLQASFISDAQVQTELAV